MSESCAAAVGKTKADQKHSRRDDNASSLEVECTCIVMLEACMKIMASSDGESRHQELVVCGG
jgi:hypothetical protein